MTRPAWIALSFAVIILGGAHTAATQEFQIGIIDFYGLGGVPVVDARRALTFTEGDTVSLDGDAPPAFLAESERRLAALPGVIRARTNLACCEAGGIIIYVGIEAKGGATLRFREVPGGTARLSDDLVLAGDEFSKAFMAAVERGDATEDDSQGHALSHDPATRAIQERFVVYAARDLELVRRVLRESSDASQRALAAQILGYVSDKQSVVDDLVHAMSDPSEGVRNNAMRALVVFTRMTPAAGKPIPKVSYHPFVVLLNSPVWTDRNKSSLALMELSERRDPELLATLRQKAMEPLVEMARWKSEGHAMPALMILARIGGRSDADVRAAIDRGDRESIIDAALDSH